MKKLHCVICSQYRKFEKPKISYLLEKTLVLSIIWSKCKNENEQLFTLNYIEPFLISASTITGCTSIFDFASLIGITIGITSSAIQLKICAIAAGIKKYKSIINNKKNII